MRKVAGAYQSTRHIAMAACVRKKKDRDVDMFFETTASSTFNCDHVTAVRTVDEFRKATSPAEPYQLVVAVFHVYEEEACRDMAPGLEYLATTYTDVKFISVDVNDLTRLAQDEGAVRAVDEDHRGNLPLVAFYMDGEQLEVVPQAQDLKTLEDMLRDLNVKPDEVFV